MRKKILNKNFIYFVVFFFLVSCSSVPKYPLNACKIFGEKYSYLKYSREASKKWNRFPSAWKFKVSGIKTWQILAWFYCFLMITQVANHLWKHNRVGCFQMYGLGGSRLILKVVGQGHSG